MALSTAPPSSPIPQGSTPVPDPTALTTAQLAAAIDALRALLRAEIHGNVELTQARFVALEQARDLLQNKLDQIPALSDEKIKHLQVLHAEKFNSIQTQFSERDTRTEQTAKDSKVAVDAALQAAKEAVGEQNKSSALAIAKSEAATTKQIDQMGLLIQSSTAGLNDKIDDLKQRLTRIEGQEFGQAKAMTTQGSSNAAWVSVVGLVIGSLIAIGALVVAIASYTSKS